MSLENIQLPPIVIQELFSHSLVALNEKETTPSSPDKSTINFLGKNLRKIALLVDCPEALHLTDDQLNFLMGVLSACQCTLEDVAIINISKQQEADYKKVTSGLKPGIILLFGVEPEKFGLPLSFPHYQVQRYNNQIYLSSPPLESIRNDKAEKTKLWQALKQIFGIA